MYRYFAASLIDFNSAVLVSVAVIVGIFTAIRGRADVWKNNYEGEKERADNFQQEITKLKEENVGLKSQPNVEKLYEMMEHHDKRAAERNKNVVKVLQAMEKRLK